MGSDRSGALRGALLVAVGAAAGALAGALAAPRAVTTSTGAGGTDALLGRIDELEQRIEALSESRAARRRRHVGDDVDAPADGYPDLDAPAIAPGAPADASGAPGKASADGSAEGAGGGDGDGRGTAVSPEFVASVRAALAEIKDADRRAAVVKKLRGVRAKYVRQLDRRLDEYQDRLGLDDATVEKLRNVATAGVDERLRAQAGGASGEKLAAMERDRQRNIRDVLGSNTYREMRKLLIDELARPTVVSVSGKAGVDKAQRDRIEGLLSTHIERIVDLDVRLQTEELDEKERQAIRHEMDDANRAAWDRMRGEILDADQRERVPKRLY